MFNRYHLAYLKRVYPDKQNANPWNPKEKIYCKELADKYYDCVEYQTTTDQVSNVHHKCDSLIRLAGLCYRLDETEFLNAANDEVMEEHYLDMYIQKQLRTKEIIKNKPKF